MILMTTSKWMILLLRLSMGWMMLYAGVTKLLDPDWTAAGYLKGAKTFTAFYQWFTLPQNINWVSLVNEWGLTLLGLSLLLGIFVRFSSVLGAVLMLLYYFPVLNFPFAGYGFLVDDHIIDAAVLLFLAAVGAGRVYGFDTWLLNLPIFKRFGKLAKILG